MLFALDRLNSMERKYSGLLDLLEQQPDIANCYFVMHRRSVDNNDMALLISLRAWRKDKVIYNFAEGIAEEVTAHTEKPDHEIPITFMNKLPFSCIATSVVPFSLLDKRTNRAIIRYTGNAFIWMEEGQLLSAWETDSNSFDWMVLDLDKMATMSDYFDGLILTSLEIKDIKETEVKRILRALHIERFSDMTEFSSTEFERISNRFGVYIAKSCLDSIDAANRQEQILQRVINIILYLNCTNADIEAVEEKLKAGAWASIFGGNQNEHISKTKRRQALREADGVKVLDVGYRVGAKFKRSYSGSDAEGSQEGDGLTKRGYGKRRAHYHHFWIGPREAPLAEDIMNPAPGERGMVLYWLDATEIHPELRDELATVVEVGRQ